MFDEFRSQFKLNHFLRDADLQTEMSNYAYTLADAGYIEKVFRQDPRESLQHFRDLVEKRLQQLGFPAEWGYTFVIGNHSDQKPTPGVFWRVPVGQIKAEDITTLSFFGGDREYALDLYLVGLNKLSMFELLVCKYFHATSPHYEIPFAS